MGHWGYSNYIGGSESEIFIKPSEIFYSQDSVARRFRDGRSVNEAVLKLMRGTLQAEDFPTIEVVKRGDGKYYSLDNRRLYVFRVGQCHGIVAKVPALVVPEQWHHQRKFTTNNGGTKIRVRSDKTYRNWLDGWSAITQSPERRVTPRSSTAQPQRLVRNSNPSSVYAAAGRPSTSRPTHLAAPTRYTSLSNQTTDVVSAFETLSLTPRPPSRQTTGFRFGSTPVEYDGTCIYRRSGQRRERPVYIEATGAQRMQQQLTEREKLMLIRLRRYLYLKDEP